MAGKCKKGVFYRNLQQHSVKVISKVLIRLFFWILFNTFVLTMIAIDIGIIRRGPRIINFKEAIFWTVIWVSLAIIFNLVIFFWRGPQAALEFLTAYLVEESLSADNIFAFLMIFQYFCVPVTYQHKVLIWGIIGALIMRAGFIFAGITLIRQFHWIIYVFGSLLIFAGLRMVFQKDKEIQPEKNFLLRLIRRFMPVTQEYINGKFFVLKNGRYFATPLFIVLLFIETTDIIFAIDSIPAVLAITLDPFIVYTSNVFAIMGLRSLYFALAGMMQVFHHLHYGLSTILIFVGIKMLISENYKIPTLIALSVIATLLLFSIIASIVWPKNKRR